ncbi:hypothetical protein GOC43_27860, partial [Sinorhizobium meliloti]|nr:hypothetical protein [Sinorhizobium meliloti]
PLISLRLYVGKHGHQPRPTPPPGTRSIELLPGATHETKRWVKYDSDLDPLRSHPRFPMVLELLG